MHLGVEESGSFFSYSSKLGKVLLRMVILVEFNSALCSFETSKTQVALTSSVSRLGKEDVSLVGTSSFTLCTSWRKSGEFIQRYLMDVWRNQSGIINLPVPLFLPSWKNMSFSLILFSHKFISNMKSTEFRCRFCQLTYRRKDIT